MKTKSNHAAAAAMIRAEFKRNGIKATVTCTGGSSVTVTILQDLTPAGAKLATAYCNQFQYGHFNGMDDYYEYSNRRDDLPQVKYVFVSVRYSDAMKANARAYIANINGIEDYERDRYEYMALKGSWGNFWQQFKPRVRLA